MPGPTYSRKQLYSLKKGNGYPEPTVIETLKTLNIFHARGNKRGRNFPRYIGPVIIKRRNYNITPHKPYQHFEVPRIWYSLPSLLLSNVTSLSNKIDELTTVINKFSPGIVAITEAWQIVPDTINIDNYSLFCNLRTNKRGGGVALFSKNELSPILLPVNVPDGLELLWIRITPPCHPRHSASIICCVVYHPPRHYTRELLLEHLTNTSDTLKLQYPSSKIIICGDFN